MPRLTYANVMATIAVFVALGGTGYAASRIPRHSVGHAQLRTNAVTSLNVRNGTLRARDFKSSDLPRGPRGPRGPKGSTGSTGSRGATGPTGPAGPTATAVAATNPLTPPAGPTSTLTGTTITTKASGPLVITALGTLTGSGAGDAEAGIYVDGAPVAHTGEHVAAGSVAFNEIGRTGTLPAGPHSVIIATKPSAPTFAVSFSGAGLSVIAATG
jgi:hypothetical protein